MTNIVEERKAVYKLLQRAKPSDYRGIPWWFSDGAAITINPEWYDYDGYYKAMLNRAIDFRIELMLNPMGCIDPTEV